MNRPNGYGGNNPQNRGPYNPPPNGYNPQQPRSGYAPPSFSPSLEDLPDMLPEPTSKSPRKKPSKTLLIGLIVIGIGVVGLIAALLLLLTSNQATGTAAATPTTKTADPNATVALQVPEGWQNFTAPNPGNFSLITPPLEDPKGRPTSVVTRYGRIPLTEFTANIRDEASFNTAYGELPPELKDKLKSGDLETILKELSSDAANSINPPLTGVKTQIRTFGDSVGVQLDGQAGTAVLLRSRIFVYDTKLYIVRTTVTAQRGFTDVDLIYLDSFKIIKNKPTVSGTPGTPGGALTPGLGNGGQIGSPAPNTTFDPNNNYPATATPEGSPNPSGIAGTPGTPQPSGTPGTPTPVSKEVVPNAKGLKKYPNSAEVTQNERLREVLLAQSGNYKDVSLTVYVTTDTPKQVIDYFVKEFTNKGYDVKSAAGASVTGYFIEAGVRNDYIIRIVPPAELQGVVKDPSQIGNKTVFLIFYGKLP